MTDALHRARLEAAEWFVLLEDEPDDAALRDRFDAWLEADSVHSQAWARISDTAAIVARSPAALRDRWDAPAAPTPFTRRLAGRGPALALAAMAAAVLVMLAPWFALHVRADHVSGSGSIRDIVLADGSKVRLGPDSAVGVSYDGSRRTIRLLAGQAWFDVAPDPVRPFSVAARGVTATALGTAFGVRLSDAEIGIEVDHGRVRVGGALPADIGDLTAGRWVSVEEGRTAAGDMPVSMMGAWRQREIHAVDQPISEVIDELRPWYAGRIVIVDAALADERVSGIYSTRDPAEALRVLVHPHGGTVTSLTPWLLIVSRS